MSESWAKTRLHDLVPIAIVFIFLTAVVLQPNAMAKMLPTTHTVTVGGDLPHAGGEGMYMGYNPSVIVITAGDTVVWTALDGPHTVSSENVTADGKRLFDSQPNVPYPLPPFLFGPGGFIPPGGTFSLDTSSLNPGTYQIMCTIHLDEGMKATLTITNETAPASSQFNVIAGFGSPTNDIDQFVPDNITVAHGTRVNFVNLSGVEVHTVASVVTLSNGTRVIGTLFDSSPIVAPPGTSVDNLPIVNMAGVEQLGGAMFPLPGKNTFSYTFNDPGTYLYFCKYHSSVENGNIAGMVGEVIVQPEYGSSSDIASISTQMSGQVWIAMAVAFGGIILAIIAIILAVLARKRKP